MTGENGINATMLLSPANGNIGGYGYPTMPMMPMMPFSQGNNGGMFGGNDSWLGILFLIALCNGGFGFGGGFGGGYGNMMLGYDFPWILNGQNDINNNVSDGFRDAQLNDNVTSIRDSISNLATQLCQCCSDMQLNVSNGFNSVNQNICSGLAGVNQNLSNGFAGVNATINGAQNAISQQLNTNEIASLNRSFAEQTANAQGFNNLNAGVADLRYTVATEACADRAAIGDALQNVTMQNMGNTNLLVSAIRDGIQSIKDDLCADRLDAERRENQNLRTQLNMATLAASQTAQTAQIRAGQNDAVNSLVNELRNCPIPSQPVYGSQPIFTCPNNNGCGCNGGF